MAEKRVMKVGDHYEIQEKSWRGHWMFLCECDTIESAKEMLKLFNNLEGERKENEEI